MALPTAPFDAAKSIYAGKKIIQVVLEARSTSAATATASGTEITSAGHSFAVGDLVQFVSGTGFTGIAAGKNYYVVTSSTDKFSLSETKGGTAITITVESSAGVFAPVEVFESNNVKQGGNESYEEFKRYGDDGRPRTKRKIVSESVDKITWEVDEAKRLLSVFNGRMNGLAVAKGVTLWVRDPNDATGTVALRSSTFAANITRQGEINLEKKVVVTLEAESTEDAPITFTKDVSVAA